MSSATVYILDIEPANRKTPKTESMMISEKQIDENRYKQTFLSAVSNKSNSLVLIGNSSNEAILAIGALLNTIKNVSVPVLYTTPGQVDKLPIEALPAGRTIGIVGLAVNHQLPMGETLTKNFITKIIGCGHEIIFIAGGKNRAAWESVCNASGLRFDKLILQPQDSMSSCATISNALEEEFNDFSQQLLTEGDLADKNLFVGYAKTVNEWTSVNVFDNNARAKITEDLAKGPKDSLVATATASKLIKKATKDILKTALNLNNGIVMYEAKGRHCLISEICNEGYKSYNLVVIFDTAININGDSKPGVIFAAKDGQYDLTQTLKTGGFENAYGTSFRANLPIHNTRGALQVLRQKFFH